MLEQAVLAVESVLAVEEGLICCWLSNCQYVPQQDPQMLPLGLLGFHLQKLLFLIDPDQGYRQTWNEIGRFKSIFSCNKKLIVNMNSWCNSIQLV